MYANGFFEQQRRSPVSFAAVVGLHAAALGAVIMFGTTTFVRVKDHNPIVINVPIPDDPPPIPPPPTRQQEPTSQHQSVPTPTPPDAPPVSQNQIQTGPVQQQQPPVGPIGPQYAEATTPRIPEPVRHAAEVDPRYRDALQPPYPRDQETLQNEGRVQVRITIGTDGRVTAIERIGATNDSFWRVTERQARSRWRFRPATVDGRPIVSTMVFTVTFRLPDA